MTYNMLIIFTSFLILCDSYSMPQKKNCIRPMFFKDVTEVVDYVKCIKTVTGSPPYGKRSAFNMKLFRQNLYSNFHRNHPSNAEITSFKDKFRM